MDKRKLVESDFTNGALLVEQLEQNDFPVHSALWLYDPDNERWRLIISSIKYDLAGPRKAYEHIDKVIRKIEQTDQEFDISLENITVKRTNDSFIKVLEKIQIAPNKKGTRFTRRALNNFYIEDAYIYRVGA